VKTGLTLRFFSKRWLSSSSLNLVFAYSVCGMFATGCVAQQADLARIQKDLELQIAKIKEEKKALGAQVDEARSAITASQNLLAKTKTDIAKMQNDLAPRTDFAGLNQQIKLIREQDLAMLYGKDEETEKRISDLEKSLKTYADSKLQIQSDQIQSAQTQSTTLAQQVDKNNQALTANMTEFQNSFAQFKETLASLGTTIGQVQTDLTAQRQELGTVQNRTDELSGSIEKSGTLFSSRFEEQSSQIAQLQKQVTTLQDKLNADTQALRTYLDQDVKTAMAQLVNDIDRHQEPVLARMDALQKDLDILGTYVQADATQVQDLSQSVLKLREAQEVMGSLLGKRGDEIIQQAGRLSERMNTVEAHQTGLTEQLQSNTQKTSTHLSEVNASLTSISQALDQTRQSLSSRLAKQEELGHTLNQTVQQFQQLKQDTQGQIQQMQSAGQVTDQLRKTVEQIRSRLHDLEIHQSGLVGKLDSDAQVTNTHMQEVNSGINSVAQALENVSAKLNGRIDDQEQRLNRAMTTFQRVQGAADTSQNNVAHLNKLTETVNQLREVVNTIGTKLGERVDQHEDRLGQLAQRVNRLQGPKQHK
jgi:chromosome segregation ATPase